MHLVGTDPRAALAAEPRLVKVGRYVVVEEVERGREGAAGAGIGAAAGAGGGGGEGRGVASAWAYLVALTR